MKVLNIIIVISIRAKKEQHITMHVKIENVQVNKKLVDEFFFLPNYFFF